MTTKFAEITLMREDRPHCIYCGFDGNYHTMRKYHRRGDIMKSSPVHYACDACGHACWSEEKMQEEIASYKNGFNDYTIRKKRQHGDV